MKKEKSRKNSKAWPKKSLGQNFLRSEEALEQIIKAGELKPGGNVLEIGPGEGVLTDRLLENGQHVTAIEKDKSLVVALEEKFHSYIEDKKLKVIAGDALEVNIFELTQELSSYKVIANIPYYITGKILRIFFDTEIRPELMVMLVQKEVAERICAEPGKMSILGVVANFFGEPEFVAEVGKENFYPEPKVDSAIIRIADIRERFSVIEKEAIQFAKIGFSSPRKTLENNLSAGLKMNKDEISNIIKKAGLERGSRPQMLSKEDWKKIAENFEAPIS